MTITFAAPVRAVDHGADIRRLRKRAAWHAKFAEASGHSDREAALLALCADLLELHDKGAASLDRWEAARFLVEREIGRRIDENGL